MMARFNTDKADVQSRAYAIRPYNTDKADVQSRAYAIRPYNTDKADVQSRAYAIRPYNTDKADVQSRAYAIRPYNTDKVDVQSRAYAIRPYNGLLCRVLLCLCFWGLCFGALGAEASGPASRPTQKTEGVGGKRFRHEFEGRLHITSDHTGLDSGVAPEFQYRFWMDKMLELRAGIRYAPPGAGDALRYYLGGFVHIPLPLVRDGALGIMMLHNSYGDIQKGENSFLFLHRMDTRYFAFDGGLLLRMELTRPENFRNPLYFGTEYIEVFYVYDMRVKIDFTFPKLGGSVLEMGAGIMNFLDNEVLGPATGGYRLYASWSQPGVGRFEAMGGMYSYGFWAFAGYYGRWFLRFSYTYTLDI